MKNEKKKKKNEKKEEKLLGRQKGQVAEKMKKRLEDRETGTKVQMDDIKYLGVLHYEVLFTRVKGKVVCFGRLNPNKFECKR